MSPQETIFTSLGLVVLDEIRFPDQEPVTDVLGGSGVYATLGARLFLVHPETSSLGWMIHAGFDFPETIEEELRRWNTAMTLRKESQKPSTRGLPEYQDTTFGPKTFRYTTPVLAVEDDMLSRAGPLTSEAFHFLESPQNLESRVQSLLRLREKAGIFKQPLIIWEPAPLSCKSENLDSYLQAARLVDVFSPNHLELLAFFGRRNESALGLSEIEILAQRFVERGIGPEGKGCAVVRAGENGCLVKSYMVSSKWLPPFYTSGTSASAKVVDPTGAGNAFLGAYAVGFLKTGNVVEAACYGSVGSSFALGQVGIPKMGIKGDEELWNGVSVVSRLREYTSRLDTDTSTQP